MYRNKISVEKAKELALKEIASLVANDDILPMIIESPIIVFDWGVVLNWNDERALTGNDSKRLLYGRHQVLVDRISQKVVFLNQPFLDIELEEYRELMGYPHVLKFPPQVDLSSLDDVTKAITLLGTQEVYQIKQGIELIQKKKLFNLNNLLEAKMGRKVEDLVIDSLKSMFWKGISWYESTLESMPKEIKFLKSLGDTILIKCSNLRELPNEILELEELEKIELEHTPIEKIPQDFSGLQNLKTITIEGTKINPKSLRTIKIPKDCTLEII